MLFRSSLSKVFRQFYGISPNEYRNNKDYVIMEPNRIMPDMELKVEVKDLPGKQVAYIRLNGGYKEIDYLELGCACSNSPRIKTSSH